ncbi:MAG: GTPase ObgE [Desulfatiglans sp.]|jgi:GTP-binding protein|nr:GTPase ObgE [Desulfatiglans sp.]
MNFLDEAAITVVSGDGGKGCVSFKREKFIPRGGPDGGDGGDGGSVIFRASKRLHTLADFKQRRLLRAGHGKHGRGNNQSGKSGADLIVEIPLGTVVKDGETNETLFDLTIDAQEVIVATGGKGGKGNRHFASSTNRAPRFAQQGLPGCRKGLTLSLKFLADIGLVGLPNAGKSTLLSSLSMAHPKIDSYPFTTIRPNLGVMSFEDERAMVIADIPGLIQGAGSGRGLGHRFLKHIERARLLLHLLDITHQSPQDILEDFHVVRKEMEIFNPALLDKPYVVLINKIDLCGTGCRDLGQLQDALDEICVESLPISALTGEGLEELKGFVFNKWL